ncbi:histidine triad nucleotide-binding protein 3 [Lingula anatina]|nr:histidine triad nucleotide-binding protein 3 [Lingula anatina]|eukprot:XP_013398032.1 histidine triad nucleotide-binding protein 3 [Lingula anatina]
MAEAGEQSCVFCKIANGKDENAELLFQDEAYAVFRDHKPAASTHLLVVPKAHISDAKSLKKQDLELVTTMVKIGEQVLQEHGGEVTKAR